jgi:hypothetical protein
MFLPAEPATEHGFRASPTYIIKSGKEHIKTAKELSLPGGFL